MVDVPFCPSSLSQQIDKLHISYLQAEESPRKIEKRTKLESWIRKFLCTVDHGQKFIFRETVEVLHQSVALKKENYSGYRASTAWNAIARYAANLIAQPWRKEFTVIKTFSGFYMHDIEENLVGAELLLEQMGYKQVDRSSLVLDLPLDVDAVVAVSRDALTAFVECQIMKEIWEGLSSQFKCSWMDILIFRENHIGSPDMAIKGLMCRHHESRFRQQQSFYSVPVDSYHHHGLPHFHHHPSETNFMYGQAPPPPTSLSYYNNYPTYPPYAVQTRYASLVSPPHVMAPPVTSVGYPVSPVDYHGSKPPLDMYHSNGYHFSHHPQAMSSNGYPPHMAPQNYNCAAVPTAQLIELESSTSSHGAHSQQQKVFPEDLQSLESRNGNSTHLERSNNSYSEVRQRQHHHQQQIDHYNGTSRTDQRNTRPNTLEDLKPKRNGGNVDIGIGEDTYSHGDSHGARQNSNFNRNVTRKTSNTAPGRAMQDGTGTWESWDYVFKNLENHGYTKDVGDRGDILYSPGSSSHHENPAGNSGSIRSSTENHIRNSRISHSEISPSEEVASRSHNISDAFQHIRLDQDHYLPRHHGTDTVDSRSNVHATSSVSRGSPVREKIQSKVTSVINKTLHREPKKDAVREALSAPARSSSDTHNTKREKPPIWQCNYCTFHNELGKEACEMCGKSRNPGPEEKPLVSGGRECPKCTLVNERGIKSCVACDENLQDSPTYI